MKMTTLTAALIASFLSAAWPRRRTRRPMASVRQACASDMQTYCGKRSRARRNVANACRTTGPSSASPARTRFSKCSRGGAGTGTRHKAARAKAGKTRICLERNANRKPIRAAAGARLRRAIRIRIVSKTSVGARSRGAGQHLCSEVGKAGRPAQTRRSADYYRESLPSGPTSGRAHRA